MRHNQLVIAGLTRNPALKYKYSDIFYSGLRLVGRNDVLFNIASQFKPAMTWLILFVVALLLSACAGVGVVDSANTPSDSAFIGTARGQYANVHYRLEEGNIVIAFENITTAAMAGLVVDVSQSTSAGFTGSQRSTRLLKMRNFFHITIPIAHLATGAVTVNYFFTPRRETIAPSTERDIYDVTGMMSERVSFKLAL